jgi:hypothetical protein
VRCVSIWKLYCHGFGSGCEKYAPDPDANRRFRIPPVLGSHYWCVHCTYHIFPLKYNVEYKKSITMFFIGYQPRTRSNKSLQFSTRIMTGEFRAFDSCSHKQYSTIFQIVKYPFLLYKSQTSFLLILEWRSIKEKINLLACLFQRYHL